MPTRIELVGVYQLPVTADLSAAQAELLYGEHPFLDQRAQVRHQLGSTVLVEVLVSDADANFDVADFSQEDPALPRANWQVAWAEAWAEGGAEAFLSADGDQLLVERWEPLPPNHSTFRIAFFIHEWQVGRPLRSSYGNLPGAEPTPMPDRLRKLVL